MRYFARRIFAQLGLRPTDASLWRIIFARSAITLALLATSLGRPQAKRDASAKHLRTSSAADIANNQNAIALNRRQSAQHGLFSVDASLWRIIFARSAITLALLATSLGRPQAKRTASAQHLQKSCAADIANK